MMQPHLDGIDPGPSARARQAAGDSAETWAETVHRLCEVRGVAWVRQVAAHLRVIAGGKVVPAKAGTIDALGVLRGGRMVGVEVKSCSNNRLDLARLPPQQRAHLAKIEALGGVALVLLVGPTHAFAVEWRRIARLLAAGSKSFSCTPLDSPADAVVISRLRPHAYLATWAAPAPTPAPAPRAA